MKKKNDGNIRLYYSDDRYLSLAEDILAGNLDIIKVLKDDNRSRVLLVNYQGEKLVVKEPKEKNRRRWQRFLSIFRGSSSYLEMKNCNKIIEDGFLGARGILAVEVTNKLWVEDSYFVSSYIDGREGSIEHLEEIGRELKKIHKRGYLHGDSQLVNFMVGEGGRIYLIDCKLSKNIYGTFGSRYEFIYLEESCPGEIDIFPKDDIYYRGAKMLNSYLHWYGRTKKRLRGKK
ncbi:lipopolysaccharide core heptose(II) kinase RfaY [Propionigenium maris]|nr:lipopolysaccharide core heptose(II) kinase RfaY [Propionigenium maris]